MASKASNAKLVQQKLIYSAITVCSLAPYLIISMNLFIDNGLGKLQRLCMGLPFDGHNLNRLVNIPLFVLTLFSAIFYDYKMVIFVQNQSKIKPTNFIPWKLVASEKRTDTTMVPIRATVVSTMFMMSFWIILLIYMVLDDFWSIPIIITLYSIFPLPITLIFSIKHFKQINTGNAIVLPPAGLQFHEDLGVDGDNIGIDSQVFHVNVNSIEKSFVIPPKDLQYHEDFDLVEDNTGIELEVLDTLQDKQNDITEGPITCDSNISLSKVKKIKPTNVQNLAEIEC